MCWFQIYINNIILPNLFPKNSTHSQYRDMLGEVGDFRMGREKMVCFIYQSICLDVLNRKVYKIPWILILGANPQFSKKHPKKKSFRPKLLNFFWVLFRNFLGSTLWHPWEFYLISSSLLMLVRYTFSNIRFERF